MTSIHQTTGVPLSDRTAALFARTFNVPQRTPEWYEARKGLITASDAAAAIGVRPFASYSGDVRREALVQKLGGWAGNIYCSHGQWYEDEACALAAKELGMTVFDFGLLRHPELEWLGASPDGVTACGALFEIKCPLRREIVPGEVPHHYLPQVQAQLEVCDVETCYFIQYKPACLTGWGRGAQLDITRVDRDRAWFARHKAALHSFFLDFQDLLRSHVPAPPSVPAPCPVDLGLYGEVTMS